MTAMENAWFLYLLFTGKPKNSYWYYKKSFQDSRIQDNADSATVDALHTLGLVCKMQHFQVEKQELKLFSPPTPQL